MSFPSTSVNRDHLYRLLRLALAYQPIIKKWIVMKTLLFQGGNADFGIFGNDCVHQIRQEEGVEERLQESEPDDGRGCAGWSMQELGSSRAQGDQTWKASSETLTWGLKHWSTKAMWSMPTQKTFNNYHFGSIFATYVWQIWRWLWFFVYQFMMVGLPRNLTMVIFRHSGRFRFWMIPSQLAVCQNLVPLVKHQNSW